MGFDAAPPVSAHTQVPLDTYLRYAAAGGTACMITHVAVVPIDVVKTRIQTTSGKYPSLATGMKLIAREEGNMMLLQGFGSTFVGYFAQGALKFGLYEYFKKQFTGILGDENAEKYRLPMWLVAGGIAEFFGDIALCPFEATRIRLVAQPDYAKGLVSATLRMGREEGMAGFYKGLPAIVSKQV